MNRRKRQRILADLDQDIRDHLARETQDNIDRGMSPEEAHYAALRKFGNVARVQEDTREVWSVVWLERFCAGRPLRPAHVAPFPRLHHRRHPHSRARHRRQHRHLQPDQRRDAALSASRKSETQLVVLRWARAIRRTIHGYMSSGDCPSILRRDAAESHRAARSPSRCFAKSRKPTSSPESLRSPIPAGSILPATALPASSTANSLRAIFSAPWACKPLPAACSNPTDDCSSAAPVAVLNYGYWQSAFGGSRDVIGRSIELNNVAFTIVGVAESRFTGITPGSDYDVWLPLSDRAAHHRSRALARSPGRPKFLVAHRRRPAQTETVPLAQTQAALTVLFRNEMLHGHSPAIPQPAECPRLAPRVRFPGPPPAAHPCATTWFMADRKPRRRTESPAIAMAPGPGPNLVRVRARHIRAISVSVPRPPAAPPPTGAPKTLLHPPPIIRS